jgi:aromatic-L-amino-acid decarboxylase
VTPICVVSSVAARRSKDPVALVEQMAALGYPTIVTDSTREAFDIEASYVPQDSAGTDFYRESIQWSRRFIGLKLFMTLAHLGLDGCARHVEHQAHIGDYLRAQLAKSGWLIVNDTPLPLVCFTHPIIDSGDRDLAAVRQQIVHGGHRISTTALPNGRTALRACITNYATAESDIRRPRRVGESMRQRRHPMSLDDRS